MKVDKELVNTLTEYYKGNYPKTTSEYVQNYPKGFSRQVLKSKYNLNCRDLLDYLNNQEPQKTTLQKFLEGCESRGLEVLDKDIDSRTFVKNTKTKVRCLGCQSEFETYWDTLSQTKKGCKSCVGMLEWAYRKNEIELLVASKGYDILEMPSNITLHSSEKLVLRCGKCGSAFCQKLKEIKHPRTDNGGSCPNCRDTDRRVSYQGITFGSQFERDCYKVFESLDLLENLRLQVPYKELNSERQWSCDFVYEDFWIEVSNFKIDYKNYLANIEEKREFISSKSKSFKFFSKVSDLRKFIIEDIVRPLSKDREV